MATAAHQMVLGSNSFLGLCVPYGVEADCGAIYRQGDIHVDGPVVCLWEHHCPVGLGRLHELDSGIVAVGRIASNTETGRLILQTLHSGLRFGLCLSIDGNGDPRELSVVLRSGFPGCVIAAVGPVSFEITAWDEAFFPEGTPHLLKIAAEATCAHALTKVREHEQYTQTNTNGASREQWLAQLGHIK